MTKLTRRTALGLSTSVIGLAACGGAETDPKKAKTYAGKVSFDHGVASGDPQSDGVIIWTRVTTEDGEAGDIPVTWYVTDHTSSADGNDVKSGAAYAKASQDWCVKIDVPDLAADTRYSYFFQVETSEGTVQSEAGNTRTTPESGEREIKLAFVSCSNYPFGLFNAYEAVSKEKDLDAIIHLGDYLYEYGPDGYGGKTGEQIGRPHDPPHEIKAKARGRTENKLPCKRIWNGCRFANRKLVKRAARSGDGSTLEMLPHLCVLRHA